MNSLKNSNFRVVKCFKLILSWTGQLNNYGSYMLIGIIVILLACILSYLFKGNKIIDDFIQNVIKQKFYSDKSENSNNQDKTGTNKINSLKKKKKKTRNNKKSSKSVDGKNNEEKKKEIKYPPKKKAKKTMKKRKTIIKNDPSFELKKDSTMYSLDYKDKSDLINKQNIQFKKNNKNIINESIDEIKIYDDNKKYNEKNNNNVDTNEINALNDEELNNLEYENALLIDKRTYCQYYFSLLKKKHLILFTFLFL